MTTKAHYHAVGIKQVNQADLNIHILCSCLWPFYCAWAHLHVYVSSAWIVYSFRSVYCLPTLCIQCPLHMQLGSSQLLLTCLCTVAASQLLM